MGTHFFLFDPDLPVIKDIQDDILASAMSTLPESMR
jgi:hypothetical protein